MTQSRREMVMTKSVNSCVILVFRSRLTASQNPWHEKTRKSKDRVVRRDRPIIHPIPLKSEVINKRIGIVDVVDHLYLSMKTGQPRLYNNLFELIRNDIAEATWSWWGFLLFKLICERRWTEYPHIKAVVLLRIKKKKLWALPLYVR